MNLDLGSTRFGKGNHPETPLPTGNRDLCIMEAVAFMAGEPWSDKPVCASPVATNFLRSWQDALSDEDRDRLLPASVWIPRLIGSRGDEATEERRAFLVWDWVIRTHTPAWMELVPALAEHAAALRALPEIVDLSSAGVATRASSKASSKASAGEAEWAVAEWAAAGRDAWAATRASAGAAAWYAAWAAAGEAEWAAAGSAAKYSAARYAAVQSIDLRPTVEHLQQSALDLLDRMLSCGDQRPPDKYKVA